MVVLHLIKSLPIGNEENVCRLDRCLRYFRSFAQQSKRNRGSKLKVAQCCIYINTSFRGYLFDLRARSSNGVTLCHFSNNDYVISCSGEAAVAQSAERATPDERGGGGGGDRCGFAAGSNSLLVGSVSV